jgi:hypothetical protein
MNNLGKIDPEALRQQEEKAETLNQDVKGLKERRIDLEKEVTILNKLVANYKAAEKRGETTEKNRFVYETIQDRLDVIKDEIETICQQYSHQVHELLSIDSQGKFVSETTVGEIQPLIRRQPGYGF